eukprot:GHVO01016113.1.p1 GENE.GHVO01016113.1~~GHVO01016113.1.p1  ORF type:complete len:317 (-),score=41.79 GHVO01016113.1:1113-2042(-)
MHTTTLLCILLPWTIASILRVFYSFPLNHYLSKNASRFQNDSHPTTTISLVEGVKLKHPHILGFFSGLEWTLQVSLFGIISSVVSSAGGEAYSLPMGCALVLVFFVSVIQALSNIQDRYMLYMFVMPFTLACWLYLSLARIGGEESILDIDAVEGQVYQLDVYLRRFGITGQRWYRYLSSVPHIIVPLFTILYAMTSVLEVDHQSESSWSNRLAAVPFFVASFLWTSRGMTATRSLLSFMNMSEYVDTVRDSRYLIYWRYLFEWLESPKNFQDESRGTARPSKLAWLLVGPTFGSLRFCCHYSFSYFWR